MPKLIDLSGERFGRWSVLGRSNNGKRAYWNCLCDCGTEREVPGQRLRWGSSSSCGCKKLIGLDGMRFGKWVVVDRRGDKSPPMWNCICDCGATRIVKGSALRDGESQSCGCIGTERIRQIGQSQIGDKNPRRVRSRLNAGGHLLPQGHPWVQRAEGIKNRCMKSNTTFGFGSAAECAIYLNSITPEKCPVFGFAFVKGAGGFDPCSPSADRIKPELGYVRGNLQVISMKANAMKANANREDLVAFAKWVLNQQ